MYNYTSYNYSGREFGVDYNSKASEVSLNISPGIAYNLTRSIQLESGLQNLLYVSYAASKEVPKIAGNAGVYKRSSFSLGSNLNPVSLGGIFVGIRFLFNK